jgi:hypothetical protein
MELAAVLERVGVADVEQQLPFHRAIRPDARRHGLAQALPQQIAAVGQPLKRVVGGSIGAEAEERVEAVEDVPQGGVELESRGCERPASDGKVNDLGIGHVVGRVF